MAVLHALDEAARNALLTSRLLPLPDAYPKTEVTMLVTFQYGTKE